MELRVLSYNIHSCFGTDRSYDPARILDVIRSLQADVVGLQEIDSSLETEDGSDQLAFFARETEMHAVQGATLRRAYGAYGNALLSRTPFLRVSESDLTYRRFEPRGLLRAEVDVDGRRVRIVNTHLGLKMWERRFQVERVLSAVERDGTPTIVLGDFNEWFPWSRNLRRLEREFGRTPRVRTFPSTWPRLCLDRIFVHPRPKRIELRAVVGPLETLASDHLPVVADLSF